MSVVNLITALLSDDIRDLLDINVLERERAGSADDSRTLSEDGDSELSNSTVRHRGDLEALNPSHSPT